LEQVTLRKLLRKMDKSVTESKAFDLVKSTGNLGSLWLGRAPAIFKVLPRSSPPIFPNIDPIRIIPSFNGPVKMALSIPAGLRKFHFVGSPFFEILAVTSDDICKPAFMRLFRI
jgi:hypothetical protein